MSLFRSLSSFNVSHFVRDLPYRYFLFVGFFFFFKQKTPYDVRISDWSSDFCSSDLNIVGGAAGSGWDREGAAQQGAHVVSAEIGQHLRLGAGLLPCVELLDRIVEADSVALESPHDAVVSRALRLGHGAVGEREEERSVGKQGGNKCRDRGVRA